VSDPPLSDLSFPRRPSGISSTDGEDHDALALLEANGIETSNEHLIEVLGTGPDLFRGAAARTLGARGERGAIGALERLAADPDALETARVQAAYALARLGAESGKEVLARELEGNPEASPAPLQAAGALARLGDARGFDKVRAALDSDNRVTAMVATKQLHAFADLVPDAQTAFARAVGRPEPNIAGEARAQLEQLDADWARELLARA
jgi:HEAT repeat protein